MRNMTNTNGQQINTGNINAGTLMTPGRYINNSVLGCPTGNVNFNGMPEVTRTSSVERLVKVFVPNHTFTGQ